MMPLVSEIDYGTPAAKSEKTVSLTIDGFRVSVPEGTSIMRAAMHLGIKVPKLCAYDMVDAFGSCRLCLVEIEGRPGTPASCTTLAADGMVVTTQNERLGRLRRNVMELYTNGNCELQDMAGAVGLREVRYGYAGANHLSQGKDISNPYFTFDPSKCIVCSRCVRACEEVQGTFALTIDGRGFASHVAAGANQPFLDSECVSCGACVQACPTATLMEKSVIELGQLGRHDLRVLRRRLQLQSRDEGWSGRPHGPLERRQGKSRPQLRQGALCLGLHQPWGSDPQTDGSRQDCRSLARGAVGRGDRSSRV
jgi:formate dehydrogenase major subunit